MTMAVAGVAQRNEVAVFVRFLMALQAELAKLGDVVNVELLLVQARLAAAAVLAHLVTGKDGSTRRVPGGAVVRKITAAPAGVVRTSHRSGCCTPCTETSLGAEAPPRQMALLDFKLGSAVGTVADNASDGLALIQWPGAIARVRGSSRGIHELPVPPAARRTESAPLPSHADDRATTFLAGITRGSAQRLKVFFQVLGVGLPAAFVRAVFPWPRRVVRELDTACRAVRGDLWHKPIIGAIPT